jgi:hypothetical protein
VACADDNVTGRNVGRAAADIPARHGGYPYLNVVSRGDGVFDHHDCVGARRHGRAGRNFGARPRLYGHIRRSSRIDAIDEA